jgi:CBS domain-containing protein
MTRAPETVPPELTLRDVVDQYFLRRRYNSFPIEDGEGNLLGLITLSRVKEVERDRWPTIRVEEVMVPLSEAVTVRSQDTLADVLTKLERAGAGRALVVDNGRLEGVISNADVAQWLERYQQLN